MTASSGWARTNSETGWSCRAAIADVLDHGQMLNAMLDRHHFLGILSSLLIVRALVENQFFG
jgi:hypothetical protein